MTGRVEDVRPFMERAAAYVVPIRIGGGTRLKIYEAMAAGKAVVSTTIGAEGLDVRHGRDILLADDAPTFADEVASLLQDAERRRRFECAASELAARFDWRSVARGFEETLARVAHEAHGHGEAVSVTASVNA